MLPYTTHKLYFKIAAVCLLVITWLAGDNLAAGLIGLIIFGLVSSVNVAILVFGWSWAFGENQLY